MLSLTQRTRPAYIITRLSGSSFFFNLFFFFLNKFLLLQLETPQFRILSLLLLISPIICLWRQPINPTSNTSIPITCKHFFETENSFYNVQALLSRLISLCFSFSLTEDKPSSILHPCVKVDKLTRMVSCFKLDFPALHHQLHRSQEDGIWISRMLQNLSQCFGSFVGSSFL